MRLEAKGVIERHLSYKDASTMLGVPGSTLRRWCCEGRIRRVKVGAGRRSRVLIPESALLEFLSAHTIPTHDDLVASVRPAFR